MPNYAAGGSPYLALFLADQAHRAPAKAPEAADDRLVLGEFAVAGQRREILDQAFDVIVEVRAP